jgi:hypothetical protein
MNSPSIGIPGREPEYQSRVMQPIVGIIGDAIVSLFAVLGDPPQ